MKEKYTYIHSQLYYWHPTEEYVKIIVNINLQ